MPDMSVVLQVSDMHFGTEVPAVVEALVRFAHELAPELLIVSGDITQRARRSQFRAARAFVDRIDARTTIAIPGNHDIPLFNLPARVLAPYGNYCALFGNELEPRYETRELLVIALNTTRARRHKDGEISRDQVARVAKRLRGAKATQLRIVVTHQPMHVTRPQDEENVCHGSRDAAYAWAEAGADLVLSGHIHLPYVHPLRVRYPDLVRDMWIANAGTGVSSRIRAASPNSVNVVRRSGAQVRYRVERWDYDVTTDAFRLAAHEAIALDRGRRAKRKPVRREVTSRGDVRASAPGEREGIRK